MFFTFIQILPIFLVCRALTPYKSISISNYNPTVGIDILSNYPFHFCVIWTGLRDWLQISDAQRVKVWQIDIGNVFSVTFWSTDKAFMPGIRVVSSYWKHFLLLFVTRKKTESAYILDSKMRIDGTLFPKQALLIHIF